MGDSLKDEQQPQRGLAALKAYIVANKIQMALWFTRVLTIFFCLGYLFPIFTSSSNAYFKALLSNGATSALRLYQRFPSVTFSREFISQLMLEDSCHYILYSLIFLYSTPIMFVIIPIGCFAVLHVASTSLPMLDAIGQNSLWFARLAISLVELQSRNILRLVSFAEIILMPFCVIMIFMGRVALLTPFIYYQFLTLRYSSRRNQYTRNMFHELRVWAERNAERPGVPQFAKNLIRSGIEITCRLAPVPVAGQQ